jgi:DNA-binding transcriptional MocR family regulator
MTADRRSIVLAGGVHRLRRRLGPTAWFVLEELLSASRGEAARCRSTATVRSLAADLGFSKDTVARALARLSEVGIVVAEQQRAPAGTFATGSYRITIPDGISLAPTDAPTPSTARPRAARPTGSQLALSLD